MVLNIIISSVVHSFAGSAGATTRRIEPTQVLFWRMCWPSQNGRMVYLFVERQFREVQEQPLAWKSGEAAEVTSAARVRSPRRGHWCAQRTPAGWRDARPRRYGRS